MNGLMVLLGLAVLPSPVKYEQYALANGLQVFLVEDHSTPLVTVDIWYGAGSRNEVRGRTGIARLFERLLFQGSDHVTAGQHYQLVQGAGGEAAANTSEDRTALSETMPSNQLALGLWLEADRMRSLKITEAGFASEREAAKQERQARVDNQPYGAAFLDGLTGAFDSTTCFPYAHSIMGSPDDLDAVELADVQAFFKRYYVPNRATLVVTGDFETAEARRLIQGYFADIARGTASDDAPCSVNYAAGEHRAQWPDALATLPAVILTYRAPPHSDPDTRVLQLLAVMAGQGEASRLNRTLVRGDHLAVQAASGLESRSGHGLFYLYAIAAQGVDPAVVRQALLTQVAALATEISAPDLDKAKRQYRATSTLGRQTTYQMAEEVQHFAHFHASPEEINTDIEKYGGVTLDDVRRVARKYLVPANSSTLTVLPPGAAPPPAEHQHQEDE